jgi:myo-inositol-1(or 4)-monophosphatase
MEIIEEAKKLIPQLTETCGEIVRKYYRKNPDVELKGDMSPVTQADREVEQYLRETIGEKFPDHSILGEEYGETGGSSEYKWVVDPIDGTKSFISGVPLFGTLIALLKNDEPEIGVIYNPVSDELVIGDNKTTTLNGAPVSMRKCGGLSEAVLLATDHLHVHGFQKGENFEKLLPMVSVYRTWGDCYGYTLLVSGYADIMLDPVMSVWDAQAVIPVIRGAGGRITDFQGGEVSIKSNSIIAAAKEIHGEVVEILNM